MLENFEMSSVLGGVLVVVAVILIVSALCSLSYVAWTALGLPTNLYVNPVLAILGILTLGLGLFIFTWAFKTFPPRDVILSTVHTSLWWLAGRLRTPVKRGPLITWGAYAYTRNPLYLGAWFMILGLGLLLGFPLIVAAFLAFWFNVVIYFEEKELLKIYGEEYEAYKRRVPKLIPWKLLKR